MRRSLAGLGVLLVSSPLWAQVSANLGWVNPTAYEDGSPLAPSQIRETRISIAPSPGGTPQFVEVSAGAATSHTILPVLTAGTWYFRAQTVDVSGAISQFSNEANFTVGVCQANPAACIPRPPSNLQVQ